MSEAIFSAEYADVLVARARANTVFMCVTRESWPRVSDQDLGAWMPEAWYKRVDYRREPERYWVDVYRETCASAVLVGWITTGTSTDYGTEREAYRKAFAVFEWIGSNFRQSLEALARLYTLPDSNEGA